MYYLCFVLFMFLTGDIKHPLKNISGYATDSGPCIFVSAPLLEAACMHQVNKLDIMAFLGAGKLMDGYFGYLTEPKLVMPLHAFTPVFFFKRQ